MIKRANKTSKVVSTSTGPKARPKSGIAVSTSVKAGFIASNHCRAVL